MSTPITTHFSKATDRFSSPDDSHHTETSLQLFLPATQTFTRFGELPVELRIKIWGYAMPGPRYVEIEALQIMSSSVCACLGGLSPITCPPDAPVNRRVDRNITNLLYTNKEAHEEVRKVFEPFLVDLIAEDGFGSGNILADLQHDVIMIPDHPTCDRYLLCLDEISDIAFLGLRHLAIEYNTWNKFMIGEFVVPDCLTRFRNLESFTIILPAEYERHRGPTTFFSPYNFLVERPANPNCEYAAIWNLGYSNHIPEDKAGERSEYDHQEEADLDQTMERDLFDSGVFDDDASDADKRLARENVILLTLECMDGLFERCLAKDPSWKVPKVEIKGLRRSGRFTY